MITNNVKRKQHGIALSGSKQNVLNCSLLAVNCKADCNSYMVSTKTQPAFKKKEDVI